MSIVDVHADNISSNLKYMNESRRVETPFEYFEEYLNFDPVADAYKAFPIDTVYRVFSTEPADVMIVLKNPNVTNSWVGENNEPAVEDKFLAMALEHVGAHRDRVDLMSRISSSWLANWFVDHPGPQVRMKYLVQMLLDEGLLKHAHAGESVTLKSFLSGDGSGVGDYVGTQIKSDVHDAEGIPEISQLPVPSSSTDISPFFEQVYVTELSKFRAPTGTWPFHLEERLMSKNYLREEIRAVDPELVVTLGERPATMAQEISTQRLGPSQFVYEQDSDSAYRILTLPHPSYPQAKYSEYESHLSDLMEN